MKHQLLLLICLFFVIHSTSAQVDIQINPKDFIVFPDNSRQFEADFDGADLFKDTIVMTVETLENQELFIDLYLFKLVYGFDDQIIHMKWITGTSFQDTISYDIPSLMPNETRISSSSHVTSSVRFSMDGKLMKMHLLREESVTPFSLWFDQKRGLVDLDLGKNIDFKLIDP